MLIIETNKIHYLEVVEFFLSKQHTNYYEKKKTAANNIFLVLGIILTIKYLATYPGFGACGVGFSAICGLRDRASDIGAFRITGSLSVQINTI